MTEPAGARQRPRFVYFDLGRVLLHFDHQIACRQMGEVSGVAPEEVREVVFERGLETRYERGELSTSDFVRLFQQATGSSATEEALVSAAGAIFQANTDVIAIVAELRGQAPLGVLSNTCEAHWQYAVSVFPFLSQHFQHCILSYEVRSMKPELEIYRAAQLAAGVLPTELFFVDDMPANVEAARSMGWDAVQYTTSQQLRSDLRVRGLL